MYSLYRAWFGGGGTEDTLSPPDTVIRVGNDGEHQFVAHKGVLAAHSGYLKALLFGAASAQVEATNDPAAGGAETGTLWTTGQPITSLSVSSIGGEAFAPLLNYMYTGRLEVTLDNVYNVLLATHLLHMPGALEQCRAALLRLRAQPPLAMTAPTTTTSESSAVAAGSPGCVLRPIPNRPFIGPALCWPQPPAPPPGLYSSSGIAHLPHLQRLHRLQPTMLPGSPVSLLPSSIHDSTSREDKLAEIDARPKTDTLGLPFVAAFGGFAASNSLLSRTETKTEETLSSQSTPATAATTAIAMTMTATTIPTIAMNSTATTVNVTTATTTTTTTSSSVSSSPISLSPSSSPISATSSIRRGKNWSSTSRPSHGRSSRAGRREKRSREHHQDREREGADQRKEIERRAGGGSVSDCAQPAVIYDVACCDGPVRFHRVLNENYSCRGFDSTRSSQQRSCSTSDASESEPLPENEENAKDRNANPNSTASYTCGYCRHTFKSLYCYRKHAKRHLLPTETNATDQCNDEPEGSDVSMHRDGVLARSRREVRFLDLNVQYYPCKICGCKFPSYYFVHKHRKLCHSNELEGTTPTELKSDSEYAEDDKQDRNDRRSS